MLAPQKISHLVIDSTGLKVYGEGEWCVRTHGADKRRTWRKLHIVIDASTQQITSAIITDKELLDRSALPELLEQTEAEIEAVCADGAYDFECCNRAIKRIVVMGLLLIWSGGVRQGCVFAQGGSVEGKKTVKSQPKPQPSIPTRIKSPLLSTLTGHSNWIRSVAFSPDGKTLASGSYDKTIKLWDVSNGQLLRTLPAYMQVDTVAFHPNGRILAGCGDHKITLWDISK